MATTPGYLRLQMPLCGESTGRALYTVVLCYITLNLVLK